MERGHIESLQQTRGMDLRISKFKYKTHTSKDSLTSYSHISIVSACSPQNSMQLLFTSFQKFLMGRGSKFQEMGVGFLEESLFPKLVGGVGLCGPKL